MRSISLISVDGKRKCRCFLRFLLFSMMKRIVQQRNDDRITDAGLPLLFMDMCAAPASKTLLLVEIVSEMAA